MSFLFTAAGELDTFRVVDVRKALQAILEPETSICPDLRRATPDARTCKECKRLPLATTSAHAQFQTLVLGMRLDCGSSYARNKQLHIACLYF